MARLFIALALVFALALAASARADYDAGLAAFERGDFAAAMSEWRPLAEAGDAEAQYSVGVMYDEGDGVPEDDAEAVRWYRRAAERGHAVAQFSLGVMYDEGYGVAIDDVQAAKWYRRAAEQGELFALYNLGVMYATGEGVEPDPIQAYRFWWLAAELGDTDAQQRTAELGESLSADQIAEAKRLARLSGAAAPLDAGWDDLEAGYAAYERGDYADAMRSWRPLAEAGDAEAQYNLGYMYDYGEGVEANDVEAVNWYRQAAEQGHVVAQFNLGYMYAYGEGVAEDAAQAAYWYRLAAQQGDPGAQYNLAVMYDEGWGVSLDDSEAIYWYREAARQGDVEAQHNLGVMYATGEGTAPDPTEAIYWYRQAALQGKADSQNNLGLMYANGEGVAQDYAEAVYWYRQAARQGDSIGQYNLGVMYRDGLGVAPDTGEAITWFEAAARQGDTDALYNLAVIYGNGENVGRDDVLGYVFFSLAAELGDSDALGWASQLAGDLSTQDLARANEIIAGWEERIAIATAAPSTLEATPESKGGEIVATGTGFIVSSSGYALTNHHVIEGCYDVRIKRAGQGSELSAVIADNPDDDLALLKMPSGSDAVATFRAGSTVRPGDDVVVIGYPLHGLLSSEVKVTTGTISAASGMGDDPRIFQMTAPVQPGNSGGPLLDRSGHIVGIVVAKLDALAVAEEIADIPQNVNFAIKSRIATEFLDSQGIDYARAPSTAEMHAADVADGARGFTVLVECWE